MMEVVNQSKGNVDILMNKLTAEKDAEIRERGEILDKKKVEIGERDTRLVREEGTVVERRRKVEREVGELGRVEREVVGGFEREADGLRKVESEFETTSKDRLISIKQSKQDYIL